MYCEGDRNYTHVHFIRRPTLMLSITVRFLDEGIGEEDFLQISRSIVVRKRCITHYDGREILLCNGVVIPVDPRRRKEIGLGLLLEPILDAVLG